jgi:short-subunit dehydrogenase
MMKDIQESVQNGLHVMVINPAPVTTAEVEVTSRKSVM